ncbi:hypothetical protein V6N12_057468 [Hibiscus sabdariffa]|uniref:Bet v I/Major latex protein domain-containing protein n=1 Tax=Hibiscus sabdariffa TaxID=183260 RepID=A0ABR2C574_9ROSI
MKGYLSHDFPVEVPAAVIWDVYRGLQLGKLLNQLLRDVIGMVEVVYGDGGVGTILKFTFPPGTPGPSYMKEVFTKIDDEQRLKEGEIFEGGLKDVGFKVYRQNLQIIEKDAQSSIIRSRVEYEIDDELQELASLATTKPMETLNEAVGKYLEQNWDSSNNKSTVEYEIDDKLQELASLATTKPMETLNEADCQSLEVSAKPVWNAAFFGIVWTLWLGRNECTFNKKQCNADLLFDLAVCRIGFWCKSRWSDSLFSLSDFIRNPQLCRVITGISSRHLGWVKPVLGTLKFNAVVSGRGGYGVAGSGEVPAAVIWDVYRGLQLGKLFNQLLRDVIATVEVVYGDGGVGTILKFTFPPGTPGPSYMNEVFTRIDDEQRLKEGEIFEGGLKDVEFKVYRQSLQIIEKDAQSSIIRSTVEYEIDDELQELASLATTQPMETLNEAVGKYLKQNWDSSNNQ